MNLTVNGKKDSIRYRGRVRLDPDEKGVDLSKPQYFSAMAEWTKKQGYVLLEPGKTGVNVLHGTTRASAGWQRRKDRRLIYSRETPTEPPEIYVTNAPLANGRKITNTQAEVAPFAWTSGSILIDFTNDYRGPDKKVKPEHLQASLHLPANYEKGKHVPDDRVHLRAADPGPRPAYSRPNGRHGIQPRVYTSNGYAVLSRTSGTTSTIRACRRCGRWCRRSRRRSHRRRRSEARRPARPLVGRLSDRVPDHADRHFKAAVAGAPLTDLVSMYSSSTGTPAAEQPIFESSQGRFTGGPLGATRSLHAQLAGLSRART